MYIKLYKIYTNIYILLNSQQRMRIQQTQLTRTFLSTHHRNNKHNRQQWSHGPTDLVKPMVLNRVLKAKHF